MEITAEGWGWRHAGRKAWAVRDVSFSIATGERVLLLGASGSGKSTLLAALAGIIGGSDEGEEAGRLLVDGRHPSRMVGRVGLVQQDPESQVILAKVGDDVAFGLENLAVPREQIWPIVDRALKAVQLNLPRERSTSALSGGQKQRLAIAGALAMQLADGGPGVLLLDEPTANLDPQGVLEVRDTIHEVAAARDLTLIIVEHRVDVWADLVDRVIVLAPGGGILADGTPDRVFGEHAAELAAAGAWVPGLDPEMRPRQATVQTGSILRGVDLTIGYAAAAPVASGLSPSIPPGLSTTITGPNGAGKSTLALTLAGLLTSLGGRVEASPSLAAGTHPRRKAPHPDDPISWASTDLLTRIGTVFQEPEHQFVERTVTDELGVGLRALGWQREHIDERVAELLEILHLTQVAQANPFTLSGGEKRRLSVGTVLATNPQVIVLDEPTFGQDRNTWISLVSLIRENLAEGRTIVSVTHDPSFVELLGEHRIELPGRGEVGE